MTAAPVPRWAISFADLGLLLLGCFVLLHAIEAARPKADSPGGQAISTASPVYSAIAADLFEAGEARLTSDARAALSEVAGRSADTELRIVSRGVAEAGSRLDRFELAAARVTAVARALREAGMDERVLSVSLDEAAMTVDPQRIEIFRR